MYEALSSHDSGLELGIFAKTFARPSIDEVFDAVAAHGLTCTQWNWACVPGFPSLPDEVPAATTRAVARAAARTGVRIVAISATFNIIQPEALELGLARLPALSDAARSVGCDLLTLCTGTLHATDMWTYHPGNSSPRAWTDMIDALRKLSQVARRCGVRLAIEPETANIVCDAAHAERALDDLGTDGELISIILDAANLYRPPIDPRTHSDVIDDALARLGPRIALAHAKDIANPARPADGLTTSEHYTHVAAGTGILPYPHYLAALRRTPAALAGGLDGKRLPLILHGLDETQVPAAVAFLRASIAAAEPKPGVVGCR
jgi:sugar phosphate isomerase/epimerase